LYNARRAETVSRDSCRESGRCRLCRDEHGSVEQQSRPRSSRTAAEALGGRDRILAIKTLTIEGYGQLAYQNGGGNITSSIDAPQKWTSISDYVRTSTSST
jgi:hypothetical protein